MAKRISLKDPLERALKEWYTGVSPKEMSSHQHAKKTLNHVMNYSMGLKAMEAFNEFSLKPHYFHPIKEPPVSTEPALSPEQDPYAGETAHMCDKGEQESVHRSPRNSIYFIPKEKVKTQKAKGLHAMRETYHSFGPEVSNPITEDTYLLPYSCLRKASFSQPMFARPCPITPRHGFVDSREVKTPEEAISLFNNEVLPADPQGEMIIMHKLTGRFSAVATSTGVVWGHGNDGVTGQGSGVVRIPTLGVNNDQWNNLVTQMTRQSPSDVGINNSAYYELVENKGNVTLVQMRDGPIQPTEMDYIPRNTKVKRVLRASLFPSLLDWEKHLKREKKDTPEGLVIDLVYGSLSSHYAVHGIEQGIPVITSHHPKLDEVLVPRVSTIPRLTKGDYKALAREIKVWLDQDYIKVDEYEENPPHYTRAILATATATVHAMSQWGNDSHLIGLRSQAVVSLARAFVSASLGELRHWGSEGPGRGWRHKKMKTSMMKDGFVGGRSSIYKRALTPHPLRKMRRWLETCYVDFSHTGWGRISEGGSTGFGGPNWANVAMAGLKLVRAIEKFLKTPTQLKWSAVVMAANVAVHTAHNGGFALNKWLNQDDFKRIAATPGIGFSNAHAARFVLGLAQPVPVVVPKKEKLIKNVLKLKEVAASLGDVTPF